MSLIRHKPLTAPDFGFNGVTLYDDGSGDLWYVDMDGDLLFWDDDEKPDFPYMVRRVTDVKLGDTDDNDVLERAFVESSPVINFQWSSFVDGSLKQDGISWPNGRERK